MIYVEIENGHTLTNEQLFDFLYDLLWRYESGEFFEDDEITIPVPEHIIAWAKKIGAEDDAAAPKVSRRETD